MTSSPTSARVRILKKMMGLPPGTTTTSSLATSTPRERLTYSAMAWRRRSEEHTSELQSQSNLVCRLLLEKKKKIGRPGDPTSRPEDISTAPRRAADRP